MVYRLVSMLLAVAMWSGLPGQASQARELASAPEVGVIGFSADGRYFAYEQFLYDDLDTAVTMAIDIVDRTTGRSVDGFPLGFLGSGANGSYPERVGVIDIHIDESLSGMSRLIDHQHAVRDAATPALRSYGIAPGAFRRLAGSPVTDRSPPGHFDFVRYPTLDGAVADMQDIDRVSVQLGTDAPGSCIGGGFEKSEAPIILRHGIVNREAGASPATAIASMAWPMPEDTCPLSVRITDILAPAYSVDHAAQSAIVVIVLATSTGPHAESGRYFARFIEMPR